MRSTKWTGASRQNTRRSSTNWASIGFIRQRGPRFGIGELLSDLVEIIPAGPEESDEESEIKEIRVSIVGRPNVGKSTLVNQILGAPRVIVSPVPGTTRDAVDSPFERDGQPYVLIDTAGIREKAEPPRSWRRSASSRHCRA